MTTQTEFPSSLDDRPSRSQRARHSFGRFFSQRRHRSGDSLRTTVAILRAQQEATLDGILVVDSQGRILSYNRRFLEIWGIPEEVAARGDDNELLGWAANAVADWDSFIALVNHLYEHPDEVRSDDQVNMKDGRILSRATVPVRVGGAILGRAWYFRDVTAARRAELLQAVLFRIAKLSSAAENLDRFYAAIHESVGELMYAKNFYIAEYDAGKNLIRFPYYVDEYDPPPSPEGARLGRGLTAYVLRTGQPLLANQETFADLVARNEVELVGAPSVDWLGVPLKSGERTWGVLGVQSYHEVRYSEQDKQILMFVAQHVASAIEQRRKDDAVRSSERRYREMFTNNRAVQLLIDPEDGAILDANPAACDFYGYSLEQLRARHIWEINTLGEERVREEMANAAVQKRNYFRFQHRLASGAIRDVEVHSSPIEAGGKRVLYSIVHDVTERKLAEEALQRSEEKFRNIFNFAPVGIYQALPDGKFLTANPTLARMLGYDSVEELLARHTTEIYFDRREREELIRALRARGGASETEVLWKRRDGTPVWVRLTAHARQLDNGQEYFEGFVYDVTARREAEDLLRKQSAAMTASMDGIAIVDDRLRITYANDALAKLYGYSEPQMLLGHSFRTLCDEEENAKLTHTVLPSVQVRGRWRGESHGLRRDGVRFPQEMSVTAIEGNGMVCVVRDITERTYAEEQIKHLAYHDALTGLPNRLLFKDRLTVALSHAQRSSTRLAVLFLDLDRFKVINDSLGHNVGDQLLQAVATRIAGCVRDSDTLARLGGDEFTLLLPSMAKSEDVAPVAQKILEAVRYPFVIDGRDFFITTSIGISVYPEDGTDAETLIKNADTAMYQAKEQGRDNYQLFNAAVKAKAIQRIAIEQGLRRALINGEFSVHYQPIFDLRTNSISGMEALLRWNHPDLGPVPPSTFIPLAESIGLMVPIGLWALRSACTQARAWHDAGFRTLALSVNLSVTQLLQPDLVDRVDEILRQTGLPPRLLEIEITESTAMQNPDASIRTLYDLKKLGIRISLDDFGTGHSSLSYLKRFPIDTLKIDQSFVHDIISDPDTAAIVTAIIAMAHSLRLKVIAEGVEFTEQANFLRRYSCDQMQGYLIKPPCAAEEFYALLAGS
ncbi:MAG TPA: EAL domain-containing protein [Thermoanaerobaculia bacterium]|nr:EAL domain-containing protein [Thermoanaerobaculia bacterium]